MDPSFNKASKSINSTANFAQGTGGQITVR